MRDCSVRLFCSKEELISLPIQTKGYQWMMNHPKSQDILKVRSSYFVLSSAAKFDTDLKGIVKKYLNSDFETFDEWKHLKMTVYELRDDGDFFKCSCGEGLRKYVGEHNLALSIKFQNYQIPDTVKSVPLQDNRKRGRPKKNRGWWSYQ